ncbi:MAG: enoyl-CoA hydratase-related protein [Prolixibacteraceae bacterium]|nr:enoyl-CoA hydratase-related protein [Prolixibacteraceae bacterium]
MDFQFIEFDSTSGVCRITLNRPEKQNALHAGLIEELNRLFRQLDRDKSVQFVIIEGKGKSLCSGADLEWFSESTRLNEKTNKAQFELLAKMLRKLYNLPQITIALAKGNLFGGGIGLAAACDFVLVEESAAMAFSEVRLGLVPATILPFVVGRMGRGDARKLMLTGKYFNGKKAKEIGLADFVLPDGQLEAGLVNLLADLQKPAIGAVLDCKNLINKVYSGEVGTNDYERTAQVLSKRITSVEAKDHISSFLKKRMMQK